MLPPLTHEQTVMFKAGSRNTEPFYKEFAALYHTLQHQQMKPHEIRDYLMSYIDCSRTRYYTYLRNCRALRLITDSYEENRAKRKGMPIPSPASPGTVEHHVRTYIARQIKSSAVSS